MTSPRFRSRTYRRVFIKVPGNKVNIHYKKRKPSKAQCGNCGISLAGVPRGRPLRIRNLPKTMKRPERPYGGVLCSSCMRNKIKEIIRSKIS